MSYDIDKLLERSEIELLVVRNLTLQHVAEHRCTFGDNCPGREALITAVRAVMTVLADTRIKIQNETSREEATDVLPDNSPARNQA